MSTMIDFWRVENAFGEGPYTTTYKGDFPLKKKKHPVPAEDGFDPDRFAVLIRPAFGFDSIEQLKNWMLPEVLPVLDKKFPDTYRISKYLAPKNHVLLGGHQAIADIVFAQQTERFTIPEFVKEFDPEVLPILKPWPADYVLQTPAHEIIG